MLNRTVLQGRLVRDAELRTTLSGIFVASFTVAWSEKRGETETKCFLPCTAWRTKAEFIARYFTKGQEIAVEGKLSTRDWEDKEGNKRSTLELTVDEAHFCGPKQSGSGSAIPFTPAANIPMQHTEFSGFAEVPDDEASEELPF